ncbi:MAG: phenylalanine--tRNA ligase subunit alpha [Caldisericaceae bacterium]|nr:phenylalanine--tRNA ligase subunit alpha [Caldisericaceae bacterium]RLD19993.1 MAG: phenylalanine--tRNA ligase subunit alpha [Caldisericota bacterium]
MEDKIKQIKEEFKEKIKNKSLKELKELETYFLGRKGKVSVLFQLFKTVPKERRKHFGAKINELKNFIEKNISAEIKRVESIEASRKLEDEKIDVTLPGIKLHTGGLHILSQTISHAEDIFLSMGFDVMVGPEIEEDYYNFEALNIPEFHPARAMQDTFYLSKKILLRTQTSPIQVRIMEKYKPPIRIIAMGRCYRKDAPDSSHFPVFHQIEGLVIDKKVTFANLKGTLSLFAKRMFGEAVKVRFTPSYFPFVEPGAETSISCVICGGKGCSVCKNTGWLEMGGSGMVHPNVLKNVGIDPEIYQGFAFGWGIERIAMVKHKIPDIRMFYQNDLRFLKQFRG